MRFFDLHCDTPHILDLLNQNLDNTSGTVNLKNMQAFKKCIRAFAIWSPDNITEKEANDRYYRLYNIFKTQLIKYNDVIEQVTDKKSLDTDKIGAMLTLENASCLNGSLYEIENFAKFGVKVSTLTWNGENSLGFGCSQNRGLKEFGKECISAFEKNGILIDTSHLPKKGFEDVLKIAQKPIIASHSNSFYITPNKRNLSDEQVLEIIKRKGLIGLNFYSNFLSQRPAVFKDFMRHLEHMLSLGAENALAIGSDFDGAKMSKSFKDDGCIVKLKTFMVNNGISEELADKIMFKNAYEFFKINL